MTGPRLRKHEELEIPDDDPWKADKLGRKDLGLHLTRVLETITQPFVIGLHSAYGTGKTVFLRCWKQHLKNSDWPVVTFNAWETDFSKDPLIAFMAALKGQLESTENRSVADAARGQTSPLRKWAKIVGPQGIGLASRIAGRALLGSEIVQAIVDIAREDANDIVNTIGRQIEETLKTQRTMQEFRSFIEATAGQSAGGLENSRPLVVMIDELDRCRPTYAIELLECIKHLFNVKGIVFVIAIDHEQLSAVVASVYGEKLDADGYLRRFFDWQVKIPEPESIAFAEFLGERFGTNQLPTMKGDDLDSRFAYFAVNFGWFSSALGLSLRQQEQLFTVLDFAFRSVPPQASPLGTIVGPIAVLRIAMQEQVLALVRTSANIDEFREKLGHRLRQGNPQAHNLNWPNLYREIESWFWSYEQAAGAHKKSQSRPDHDKHLLRAASRWFELWRLVPVAETDLAKAVYGRESLAAVALGRLEQAVSLYSKNYLERRIPRP